MKFLAILKDSVREALDYKVIYFLFGLSVLVILVVASVSYKPQASDKGMKAVFDRMPGQRPPTVDTLELPRITYSTEDFTQLNSSRPVWEGVFEYTLVVRDFIRGGGGDDNGVVMKAEVKDKDKDRVVRTNPLYWWVFTESFKKTPAQRDDEDHEMLTRMGK